jgi:hypothetical protein
MAEMFDDDSISKTAHVIEAERRERTAAAVRALWFTGDALRELRQRVGHGAWRRSARRCAQLVGVHVATLDDALRAAEAFSLPERDALMKTFAESPVVLTPSHVMELARLPKRHRREAIAYLLAAPQTNRQLRAYIRDELRIARRARLALDCRPS